jgi:competence protein ComEC
MHEGRRMTARTLSLLAFALLAGCSGGASVAPPPSPAVPPPTVVPPSPPPPGPGPGPTCGTSGQRLRVHFYDVGQALAALVDLPDGRHVLVDTGDSPARAGCGDVCATKHTGLLEKLRADLHGAPIDLLWITHQHSDHIGGAPEILSAFKVGAYVDNGRDEKKAEVKNAHRAATAHGTAVKQADPEHATDALAATPELRITPVLPSTWPASCPHDANACSILLRIDYCGSSVLFTGDAEHDEEARLTMLAPVTLLQVGHHGSDTSTTPGFLARAKPRYAVISAGKPDEGLNADYCHPRALVVERLTKVLGGAGRQTVRAFDGVRCANSRPTEWVDAPASDRLWATSRDGDVVLSTPGDGVFTRE